ncbi:putative GPI-anchored protein [Senna tora]|uniref:Putative GPI-anchored protein n=1 Tax=Senna tora TaxID=362788 RepID=A0A834W1Q0_9FABA|nr:putative GPI-anchored protein [Senna tora]KAF7805875.1 putative GPI-anchored protein [Senna tora]
MQSFIISLLVFLVSTLPLTFAGLLSEPVSVPNTVPAFPVQTQSPTCRLDLSKELFGGVNDACGKDLDRSRCCPVLAAWLFAAHARSALEVSAPAPSPAGSGDLLPMMPDDSQKCVNSLQDSLLSRNIRIPQPNATCDAVLCFCGIRLHQISSLSCPAAFNMSGFHNHSVNASGSHIASPTAAVRNLEKNCRNSSYAGCTKCLGALQKLKGFKKGTRENGGGDRVSKMFNRDCQLMGLTWLLARNKTAYIPTVSAVLRAIMYSAHPHESKCSPDQENMPLAVDSLQFEKAQAASSPFTLWITLLLPLIILISPFL